MAYIYTQVQNDQGKSGPKNLAKKLIPAGEYTELDVIKKFPWTNTPLNSDAVLNETPYIRLKEFYLLDSYLDQLFKAYGKTTEGGTAAGLEAVFLDPFTLNASERNLYEGLYDHTNPTGFTYTFPYFTSDYLTTNNSWVAKPFFQDVIKLQKLVSGYSGGLVGGALTSLGAALTMAFRTPGPLPAKMAAALAALVAAPGAVTGAKIAKAYSERGVELSRFLELANIGLESPVGNLDDPAIDKPFIWSTTAPRSFTVTFPLYNTLTQPKSKDWSAQIIKNWELCYLLCYQNLFNKRNLFTGVPPVFYEIDIPGVHYSKAGYISNLRILNAGNIRKMSLNLNGKQQDVNVPDAYIINLTVTDFFIPSKNFMSSLGSDNKGILDDSGKFDFTGSRPTETPQYRPPSWRYDNPLDPIPEGIPGLTDLPPAPPVVPPPDDLFGG